MLGLLAETLTSQLKVMIAGTVLAVIGLTDIIIFLFLYKVLQDCYNVCISTSYPLCQIHNIVYNQSMYNH